MNKPRLILSIFALSLVVVLAAMAWVSFVVVHLDRRDAILQRQAEVQESARLALWRMDSALGPILARENTRPLYEYESFYSPAWVFDMNLGQVPSNSVFVPSPLLLQPTPFVKLHFQVAPDGQVTSPQSPRAKVPASIEQRMAEANPRATAVQYLAELTESLDRKALLAVTLKPARDAFSDIVANSQKPDRAEDLVQARKAWLNDLNTSNAMRQSALPLTQKEIGRARHAPAQQQLRSSMEYQQRLEASLQTAIISKLNRFENAQAQQPAPLKDGKTPQGNGTDVTLLVREGDMTPLWMDGRLLVVRQVLLEDETWLQGYWLDWEALQGWLLLRIVDLLPQAQLIPVDQVIDPGSNACPHVLAALPARLEPGDVNSVPESLSYPIRTSLIITWTCTLLACAAVVVLVVGMVSLSERRAAFVSAVTHELRTPLTTFRMYTEMLAGGMVKDEQQRIDYLTTLRREADRLGRLVENVLTYARLERNRASFYSEHTTAGELLDRIGDRLVQRTNLAEMELCITADEDTRATAISTDPAAVEQILFNLVENACKYAAEADDRRIHLEAHHIGRNLRIRVRDHGPGIGADVAGRLFSPFAKSAKVAANSEQGVGLGLALCRRLARRLRGKLRLANSDTSGCCFELDLPAH
jgi:signal transduction histidine kinase